MKKNIVFSMCASLLFLASCDYNKDNFLAMMSLPFLRMCRTLS